MGPVLDYRLFPRRHLRNEQHILLGSDQRTQSLSNYRMVLHAQNANRFVGVHAWLSEGSDSEARAIIRGIRRDLFNLQLYLPALRSVSGEAPPFEDYTGTERCA